VLHLFALLLDPRLDLVDQRDVQVAALDGGMSGLDLAGGEAAVEVAGDGISAYALTRFNLPACAIERVSSNHVVGLSPSKWRSA
jgi:hypothetical protein